MIERKADLIRIKKSVIERPKFTIVVPTYKRPETLQHTMKSVLSQDYQEVYSVIVVDNNPDRGDDTELFMEGIKDPRVSYYKNSINVGMINNWNQCIVVAESEWIVFVHDDDLLTEDCLSCIDEIVSTHPNIDAVLPNFVQIGNPYAKDADNRAKKGNPFKKMIRFAFPRNLPLAANLFCDNIYGPPTCGLTLKKSSVMEFGGYSDRFIAADWDLMSRFSRNHKIVKCKKQTGTYLWAVNASLNESTMEQIRKDRIAVLKEIMKHSRLCSMFYKMLRKDFDKKFASKTSDVVKYSVLYRVIRKYYSLRI